MARIPVITRDQVPEQFRAAFDELTAATGGTITGWPRVDYHQQPGDGAPARPFDPVFAV